MLEPEQLRRAFGAFPSGVVALAAMVDGMPVGMAVSSFVSVSLDPPLASVSVAASSSTWPVLRRSERLGVSVLADDHAPLALQLAGPAYRRFHGVDYRRGPGGAILLHGAAAVFETSVEREIEAGDHQLAILRLHDIEVAAQRSPLAFHRSRFTAVAP